MKSWKLGPLINQVNCDKFKVNEGKLTLYDIKDR